MIPITIFRGDSVALFGLGGSGLATARALAAGGCKPVLCDDDPRRMAIAANEGFATADLRYDDWSTFRALVLAPGVPLTHPEPHWVVKLARGHGVPILGDIELFFRERARLCPSSPVVAITGTNGKSTTTALVTHLLRSAGRVADMGGNIGTPILELGEPSPVRHHVIECSSYQIDLAPSIAPTIGVHLNLTPDHLDRHGTFAQYGSVKERLIAGVPSSGTAIIGIDDNASAAIADRAERRGQNVTRVSVRRTLTHGIYAVGPKLVRGADGAQTEVADLTGIGSLRGAHNAENAAAAYAALAALGVTNEEIVAGLRTFPGLDHRMQTIGRLGQVLFVNDSKATNADAAARALASFDDIYWIAGGRAKAGGITSLKRYFPKIRRAFLIGEAAEAFADTLSQAVPVTMCGTLDRAVEAAAEAAASGSAVEPVVLLSPACASFDQFPNFEVRGRAFHDLVVALPGVAVA